MKKLFSGIVLALLLASMLTVTFNVRLAKSDYVATAPIYILADGSISPSSAPIQQNGNTYTLTGNIAINATAMPDVSVDPSSAPILQNGSIYASTGNITIAVYADQTDGIIIQKSNVTIDGAGHTLEGSGFDAYGNGFNLVDINHVTIRNMTITNFYYGISLYSSSNDTVSGNKITDNWIGIELYSSSDNDTISGNNIANIWSGISLLSSSSSNIVGNVFVNDGLITDYSFGNVVNGNLVNGKPLVYLEDASDMVVGDAGQVVLVNCTRITVENLTLSNTDIGVELRNTNSAIISGNNLTANNVFGISIDSSSSNNVSRNNITANRDYGIDLKTSSNNIVSGNNITRNGYGILFEYSSSNNTVTGNNITANYGSGIYFYDGSNNIVSGNKVANNWAGIELSSSNNTLYHNNFINNTHQTGVYFDSVNVWDNGYPSGGNYWSGYLGVDLYSGPYQNKTGSDGIGDTPNTIDSSNADLYPLIGIFHEFSSFNGQKINIVSNSSVSNFNFSPVGSTAMLAFNVTGKYGTHGFCQVCIPKALINGSFIVMFDGKPVGEEYAHILPASNGNYTYIYINYTHCRHMIEITGTPIIPEFSSFLILPLMMIATLLAVITYRRKHH